MNLILDENFRLEYIILLCIIFPWVYMLVSEILVHIYLQDVRVDHIHAWNGGCAIRVYSHMVVHWLQQPLRASFSYHYSTIITAFEYEGKRAPPPPPPQVAWRNSRLGLCYVTKRTQTHAENLLENVTAPISWSCPSWEAKVAPFPWTRQARLWMTPPAYQGGCHSISQGTGKYPNSFSDFQLSLVYRRISTWSIVLLCRTAPRGPGAPCLRQTSRVIHRFASKNQESSGRTLRSG